MADHTADKDTGLAPPREQKRNPLAAAIIWLIIGAFLLKFVGIDGLARHRERAAWDRHQARVLSSEVRRSDREAQGNTYDLVLQFEVDFAEGTRRYQTLRLSSSSDQSLHNLADEQYHEGSTFEVLIDPADRSSFHFPESHGYGPYLLGIVPGGLCLLIGLYGLFRPRKAQPPQ